MFWTPFGPRIAQPNHSSPTPPPALDQQEMSFCKATLRAASKSAAARPLMSTRSLLSTLVRQASRVKLAIKSGNIPSSLQGTLAGKTIALMFSKRSTRTRVSTEAAVVYMGGHPMFLGQDDIQLGVHAPRTLLAVRNH